MCRFKVPTRTVKSLCRYPFRYIWSLSLRSYKVLPICSSTSAFNRASITFSTSFLLASPFRFCLILLYWKNRYDSFLFTPTYCIQSLKNLTQNFQTPRIFWKSLIHYMKKEYPNARVFFFKIRYKKTVSDQKKLWEIYGNENGKITFSSYHFFNYKPRYNTYFRNNFFVIFLYFAL